MTYYTSSGNSLVYAAQNGMIERMEKEIKEDKINVNTPDKWGNTPLVSAIRYKQEEAVKFLIQNGADVNQTTEQQKTSPLKMAQMIKSAEIEKALIQAGAREHSPTAAIVPTKTQSVSISLLQAARRQQLQPQCAR